MIKIKNLKKSYDEKLVLDIPDLKLEKGKITALTGPNGSGKTTLIRCIAGLEKISSGEIIKEGKVRYSPQYSYMFSGSVFDNVKTGMQPNTDKKTICDYIGEFNLTDLLKQKATKLSGGEKQRVSAARVLGSKCDILLLDEPTASADMDSQMLIQKKISEYCQKNDCCVVISTHSPKEAVTIADRIIVLQNGKIEEDGAAEDVFNSPQSMWAKSFLADRSLNKEN